MEAINWIPLIDQSRCTRCGDCIAECPTHAIGYVDDKVEVIDPIACNYCGQCEAVCPEEAIALPYQIVLETVCSLP